VLHADCRRRGRIVPVIDLQIAAIAKALGQTTVATIDSDLFAIPGLDAENWRIAPT